MPAPRPIVGILGGMGPAATADFYTKLVAATPATRDQDHLRVVIWADPTVPDRTAALLTGGPDPTPALHHGLQVLLRAGAQLVAVPCNTAHAFLEQAADRTGLRIISMVAATAEHLARVTPRVATVGLLATDGTVRSGLYHDWLADHGIDLVTPEPSDQQSVMAAITQVKAGRPTEARDALLAVSRRLAATGAQAVIAGCTEIPLVVRDGDLGLPMIDPAAVLADAVVRHAAGVAARAPGHMPARVAGAPDAGAAGSAAPRPGTVG